MPNRYLSRWILPGLLAVALLSACAGVTRFQTGPLVAYAEKLGDAAEPRYYSIGINTAESDDPRILSALVKLGPEASGVAIVRLSPELVAKYLPPFTPPKEWPEILKKKAREEDAYSGGGFHIRFADGRLVSVGICSHCAGDRQSPVVGTPDGRHFYALPLTEQQMIEVFGPPDRKYKVHEVY